MKNENEATRSIISVITDQHLSPQRREFESGTQNRSDLKTGAGNNRKTIRIVHVCGRCGRSFILEKGRRHCPYCLGELIVKTTVSGKM